MWCLDAKTFPKPNRDIEAARNPGFIFALRTAGSLKIDLTNRWARRRVPRAAFES